MTVDGLSAAIEAAINSAFSPSNPAKTVHDFAHVLASAIVPYIQANAVVIPTALVAPSGGGPVTGVGAIT